MDEEREAIVSLNDFHVPYHDERAIEVALKFVKFLRPYRIVIHELLDWYSLSKFNKDPKRKLQLQNDLDVGQGLLTQLREAVPDTEIIMLDSNHLDWLKKYLWSKAEELSDLRCLKLPALLKLKEMNITTRADYTFRNVLFKHGNIVRKYSAYTAKAELEQEGVSGCSGHTHRLGEHFKTVRGGKYVWLETGCLCDPKKTSADYVKGTANWQQGVGGFIFKKNSKHFYPFLCPIIDGELLWGNKTFN